MRAVILVAMFGCWSSTPPSAPISNEPARAPIAPAPAGGKLRVTELSPHLGDVAGGTYVVIKGDGFIKDGPRFVKVYFGAAQGTVVRFQSDHELIVQAPGGTLDQVVDVLVIFDPGGEYRLPKTFTFVDKSAP